MNPSFFSIFLNNRTLDSFAVGKGDRNVGSGGQLKQSLLTRRHTVPGIFIDQKLQNSGLLVPAGIVVIFYDLVKSQFLIDSRKGKLSSINNTFFKRLKNLSSRHHTNRHTQLLHHFAAKPEKSHFKTLQICNTVDRLAEPA